GNWLLWQGVRNNGVGAFCIRTVVVAHLGVFQRLVEGAFWQWLRTWAEGEGCLGVVLGLAIPAFDIDGDDFAGANFAVEDLLRELVFNLTLDGTTQRTCTQYWVEAALCQQVLGLLGQLDAHVALSQLNLNTATRQALADDARSVNRAQACHARGIRAHTWYQQAISFYRDFRIGCYGHIRPNMF